MLTPIEIQGISFKTGRGYSKKDVDSFMDALHHDYELMYKENLELKDKVNTLSDGIQYYKNLEKTLQKALVLAEKTSEETKDAAQKQAQIIERQARLNADMMLVDARHELEEIEGQIKKLMQQYELYKAQFKQIASVQLEMLDSEAFQLHSKNDDRAIPFYSEEQEKEDDKPIEEKIAPKLDEFLEKVEDSTVKASKEEEKQEEHLAKEISEVSDLKASAQSDFSRLDEIQEAEKQVAVQKTEIEDIPEKKEFDSEEEFEDDEDTDDLEVKMLQKLLKEIKNKSEMETEKKEEDLPEIDLEFINND